MPSPSPTLESLLDDSTAHSRLSTLAQSLAEQLQALPDASTLTLTTLDFMLGRYWTAARRRLFIEAMQQGLADEVALKVHAGALHRDYARCVPAHATRFTLPQPDVYAVRLDLSQFESVEIAGALVFSANDGATLLSLPGYGVESFLSLQALRSALITALNIPFLRSELLRNAQQRHQDALLDLEHDADLFVEPIQALDLSLLPLAEPFAYALDSQLKKQLADARYALGKGKDATLMKDRFGPAGMLQQWAAQRLERQHQQQLPDWLKDAPAKELRNYLQSLSDYDQVRRVLISLMDGAASAEHFAQLRLQTRIASDLGYDLDPARLSISTRRRLPLTGDSYETRRSLNELALYGLHLDDLQPGSAFLSASHFSLDDQPLGDAYPLLTPAYIGALVQALDLRSTFAETQRHTYGKSQVVQVMRQVMHQLIISEAHRSRLQGHIHADDSSMLEDLGQPDSRLPSTRLQVQQIKLNERDVLSKILLFRRLDAAGNLDRLILFTPDSPRQRAFQGFDNEQQLLHELVSWSATDSLKHYLLQQISPARRRALNEQLLELRAKPQPPASFLGFASFISYSDALYALTTARIRVNLADNDVHTPAWYLRASQAQRSELLALEDAINAASNHYKSKPHAQVQGFDEFVHQRASEKINALLGLPPGSVDPDDIVITSPREKLSYRQMLRDGYDDSLGFFNAGAAEEATFSGPQGINLAALSAAKVAGSVRGAWPSDAYVAHIKATLLDPTGEGYAWRRETSLLITQLQMQAAALRSLLKQEISAQQYAWLQTSIGVMALNDEPSRRQFPIDALQLRFERRLLESGNDNLDDAVAFIVDATQPVTPPKIFQVETVQGCYILTPFENRDPQHAMLYTPDAPDGRVLRKLSEFVNTLKAEGMSDYYKDRCRIKANRTLAFVLIGMKQNPNSQPPSLPGAPLSNMLEACYDRPLQRRIRNIEETTTGRSDMIARQIWNGIELAAIAVTLPFPLASFTVGALLALRDSAQALQALNEGDREAAGFFVLASLLNSLGAWGDLHSGLKFFGGPLRQLAGKTAEAPGAKTLQAMPQKGAALRPVILQGETFWAGKPGVKGHAPLFRAPPHDPETLLATGRFSEQDLVGVWQPVHQQPHRILPNDLTAANSSYAVKHSVADGMLIESGHAKGVRTLNGNHYIDLNRQVFQVQYEARMRLWQIIDPANPFAFFGKQPVRLGADGHWLVIDRLQLRGGVNPTYTPLDTGASSNASSAPAWPLKRYEMPDKWRSVMDGIVDPEVASSYTSDAITGPFFANMYQDGRQHYASLRQNLREDATAFFDSPPPAAKPDLAALDEAATADSLIQATFAKGNGMVISEAPGSVASKQFLIDNMGRLSLEDVDTLYIEHVLSDVHLHKLQKYQKRGGGSKSGSHLIRDHLKHVNKGALLNHSAHYDYYHLIKKAHEFGIEVRPFNSSVSYHFINLPLDGAVFEPITLRKMSTFYGYRAISRDCAAVPGRRWVALLDQKIANTWQDAPGISELHGVVSVRIDDVARDQPFRILRDTHETGVAAPASRADFRVEMANPFISNTPQPSTSAAATVKPTDWLDQRFSDASLNLFPAGPGGTSANRYAGDFGFKLNDSGQWTRADASEWRPLREPTAIQQSLVVPDYQMADEFSTALHQLSHEHRGLNILYEQSDEQLRPVRNKFFSLRARLQRDASRGIFEPLPARPAMPQIDAHLSQSELLDQLYDATSGVVIAEKHASVASKQFIIDNLPHLTRRDVRTLYLEHLQTDLHQLDLDHFAESGLMSKRLLHDLRVMDRHFHTDNNGVYTFEQLVIRAREHGIEVRAIDCAASYHLSHLIGAAPTSREQMMNWFASRVIRRHQQVMGAHPWIALVGESHANTFQKIVPGIAELEQGISVRVFDVGPGESFGPLPDPGRMGTINVGTASAFVQQDFSLGLPTLTAPPLSGMPTSAVPVEVRLHSVGLFLIDEAESSHPVILHRSRRNLIERTPIQVSRKGKLYVDHASWRKVHHRPFDDLPSLLRALKEEIFLTQVS